MGRLKELSASFAPPAGLLGTLLKQDNEVKCAMLKHTGAFEPYGDEITWPHPLN